MPDTQIILDAIGKIDKRMDVSDEKLYDVQKATSGLSEKVGECAIKLTNVEKQLEKQNGRIDDVEDTASKALMAAEHAKSIFWKRGTIIVACIGMLGALGAAAIKAWG